MKVSKSIGIACLALSSIANAQTFTKTNSVYTMKLNESSTPVTTSIVVGASTYVPSDNPGADLQMTLRSNAGNTYNPTQGGDCAGNKANLWGSISNWSGSGLGISSTNGIALGVIPRFYNDNAAGVCQGTGAAAPFNMTWGVTLGDGSILPNEVMVLDMSFAREDAGDETDPNQSELPAMFANRSLFKYMYYTTDDGDTWAKWEENSTHNVDNWSAAANSANFYKDVQAVWVSNESDAIGNPNSGSGIGIYANGVTTFVAGKRTGASNNLSYIAALGGTSAATDIEDDYWHGWRRLVLVGNLNTIKSVIDDAVTEIGGSGDWTWTDTTSLRFSEY